MRSVNFTLTQPRSITSSTVPLGLRWKLVCPFELDNHSSLVFADIFPRIVETAKRTPELEDHLIVGNRVKPLPKRLHLFLGNIRVELWQASNGIDHPAPKPIDSSISVEKVEGETETEHESVEQPREPRHLRVSFLDDERQGGQQAECLRKTDLITGFTGISLGMNPICVCRSLSRSTM